MKLVSWVVSVVFAGSTVLGPNKAAALTITINPSATMQVGTNNTVTISPITLHTPLPGLPAGNYNVQFRWDQNSNVLVPIAATRVGGGGTPTGGAVGTEINGILIEAETLVSDSLGCTLRVQVLNRTGQLKAVTLIYNAFDAAGRGIGYTALFNAASANGRTSLEGLFVTTGGGGLLSCNQIARYQLDPLSSVNP